jgi:diguanylate cyclase (GGDEF)-like protein
MPKLGAIADSARRKLDTALAGISHLSRRSWRPEARSEEGPVASSAPGQRVADSTPSLSEAHDRIAKLNAELILNNERLRLQNVRFYTALQTIPHGLSMWDAQRRLVVCNERYVRMYGLSQHLARPGTSLDSIIEDRIARGLYAGEIPAEYGATGVAGIATTASALHELSDGRLISVARLPVPDGGWITMHEDVTEKHQSEARLRHLAYHDALTSLPNRVLLRERLEQALRATARSGGVAVLCLDLDRFKEVNDTLGHPMGDALLRAVAKRLCACVRDQDTVARSSGDEFVVLQVCTDAAPDPDSLALRVLETLTAPYELGGHLVHVGTSIGIALAPQNGGDSETLLRNADMALYRSKSEGRGKHTFFEQEMNARMQHRRGVELDLRTAMANGELELVYQPIVNLATNAVSGCETLLRWNHPRHGAVSPSDFVPIAEDAGLIVPIGEWVLRQACAEAATWPEDVRVAVNVSPIQFKSNTLHEAAQSALASSGLAPHRLELEITESVLLDNSESTLEVLRQLSDLGIRIVMDDFGTGYSSLSYLRKFPFDKIKIDRCFVADITNGGADAASIVRAISQLGCALGMTITAEGVETQEQLASIRAAGCTEVQGFLVSAAVPAAEVRPFFRKAVQGIAA